MRKFFLVLLILLFAASVQAQGLRLSWDPNPAEQQVTKYHIYRSLNTGDFDLTLPLATVPANQTTYEDSDGQAWSRYFYIVRAENSFGISEPSDEVNSFFPGKPSVPTNPSIEQAGANIAHFRQSLEAWAELQDLVRRDQVRVERAIHLLRQAQNLVEILPAPGWR